MKDKNMFMATLNNTKKALDKIKYCLMMKNTQNIINRANFYHKGGIYKKNIVHAALNVKRVDACFQRLAMQDIHSFHFRFKENPARKINE